MSKDKGKEKPFSGRDENGLKPSEWIKKRGNELYDKWDNENPNEDKIIAADFFNASFVKAIMEYLDLTSKQ